VSLPNLFKKNMKDVKKLKRAYSKFAIIHSALSYLKIRAGCKICGYKKCATSLHFHHLNPITKLFNVSNPPGKYIYHWDKIVLETKKCIVLCANCHGEIHEGKLKLSQEIKCL
jgi:hypothetical protein